MRAPRDPLEQAFAALRSEHELGQPDPALEARLRLRHRRLRSRRPRLGLSLLAVGALSGAAFAASGGFDWLRTWWYRVDVGEHDLQRVEVGVDVGDQGGAHRIKVPRDGSNAKPAS